MSAHLDQEVPSSKTKINPRIEINKNEKNKNKKPQKCTEIDIDITITVTEYLYYPNESGKFNVPQKHKRNIVYGENIKALATELMYEAYNSTDTVKNIISSLTDNTIEPSKGTIYKWSKELSKKLEPEIEKIDFFKKYTGIIVKDGTNLYNGFGRGYSQCISHIQRYLKGIYDNIKHKYPKEMAKFLSKCNNRRNELKEEKLKNSKEKNMKSSRKNMMRYYTTGNTNG